ncbi:DNA recombinase (plasmid) [Azospirillum sp. B510]|uniref:recombinase family protein n=1 Tax=Azospirillum sp. (strain B510) TaxID=137722 RepID=UPI0001C4CD67|nr:DNA recombinase [Azospirillum sp. B510]
MRRKPRSSRPNGTIGDRVVIYARYSDQKQDPSSIQAQLALCQDFAASKGWEVAGEFTDAMISGATKAREGYQAMLRTVDAGGADIVFAEALDRLTRDPEESHALFKRLKHRGVRLVTLAEGEVSNIHVAVSGISNALYLEAVAFKTRRSILDKVRKGEIITGLAYGYRVVKVHAEDGTLVDRHWEIVEEQAAVVRDIFTAFAGGHSPKQIARDLNDRGVPGPRGGIWRDTTIRGHHQRASGILRNALYIGLLVFNRQSFSRNPADDAKRVASLNDESDWVRVPWPELAILPQALWDRVQQRLQNIRNGAASSAIRDVRPWEHRRQHLLTGLAVCAGCKTSLGNAGRDYLTCNTAKLSSASCSNQGSVRRSVLEKLVMDALCDRLMQDDMVAAFIAAFREAVRTDGQEQSAEQRRMEAELRKVRQDLDGLDATARQGRLTDRLHRLMRDLEVKLETLEAALASPPPPAVVLPDNLAALYRERIADLAATLEDPDHRIEARDRLRPLIERVAVRFCTADTRGVEIELEGDLVALLSLGLSPNAAKAGATGAAGLREQVRSLMVVAGAGFEPAAFRL